MDDQSIILDGLQALLAQDDEVQVVGRACNGREAVSRAKELMPDVVLMDIGMPEMDGIEATRELLACCDGTRVLALSMYDHPDLIQEILEAGASGYILKNISKEELSLALRTVNSGRSYMMQEVRVILDKTIRTQKDRGEASSHVLTKREKEVVKLICMECTTPEIATALFLSTQTIDTHRKNIIQKLGVRNTAGLVRYAKERGWC